IDGSSSARNFLELAGTYESCRIGAIAALQDFANESCPRTFGQSTQLGKGFFRVELRDAGPAIGFRRRAQAGNGIARCCRLRRHCAFGSPSTARPRIQSDQERTLAIGIFSCRDGAQGRTASLTRQAAGFLAIRTSQSRKRLSLSLSFGTRGAGSSASSRGCGLRLLRVHRMGQVCRRHPSHDDGGDGVLEDELLLTVRLQHHGVLVKRADAARQLDPAEQVNRNAGSLFTGRIKEGILNILRRLIAVHSRSPQLCRLQLSNCQPIAQWAGAKQQHVPGSLPAATGTRGDRPTGPRLRGSAIPAGQMSVPYGDLGRISTESCRKTVPELTLPLC